MPVMVHMLNNNRIGIQVLYSGVLWPNPAWVTCLHHHWGANEAEILFQISALARVWTPQPNGCKRHRLTMAHNNACLTCVITIML